jgi:hypothetical protein
MKAYLQSVIHIRRLLEPPGTFETIRLVRMRRSGNPSDVMIIIKPDTFLLLFLLE